MAFVLGERASLFCLRGIFKGQADKVKPEGRANRTFYLSESDLQFLLADDDSKIFNKRNKIHRIGKINFINQLRGVGDSLYPLVDKEFDRGDTEPDLPADGIFRREKFSANYFYIPGIGIVTGGDINYHYQGALMAAREYGDIQFAIVGESTIIAHQLTKPTFGTLIDSQEKFFWENYGYNFYNDK